VENGKRVLFCLTIVIWYHIIIDSLGLFFFSISSLPSPLHSFFDIIIITGIISFITCNFYSIYPLQHCLLARTFVRGKEGKVRHGDTATSTVS